MNMHKHYSQLIGYKITAFRFEEDEWDGETFPVFSLQDADGNHLDIILSSDEEGNEAGFAFIDKYVVEQEDT